ncbi:unnamed protein product [Penicillium salamii]|nr:unnamed protein product [Penicillium salamii]CAG8419630.1 unnamed protein product [Penicillium salamii]
MANNELNDRVVDWLEHPDFPSGVPRSVPTLSGSEEQSQTSERHQASEEYSQASGTRQTPSSVHIDSQDEPLPQEIALPDSRASSNDDNSRTGSDIIQNSLDDLLRGSYGTGSYRTRSYRTGSYRTRSPTISLQEHSVHSENTPREHRSPSIEAPSQRTQRPRPRPRYRRTLDNAASVLDHIKNGNVCKSSRHDQTHLIYYDYSRENRLFYEEIRNAREIKNLGNAPSDVYQRIVIVHDLSKSTIIALGGTFGINPEFFEEHLLNSGYAGAEYDMTPATMWSTAALEKTYVSTKWIRPVCRIPMFSANSRMQDLAKTGMRDSRYPNASDFKLRFLKRLNVVEHFTYYGTVETRVTTNIFRSESRLWTNPKQTTRAQRECGLEERMSIWKGKLPQGCDIVMEEHPCLETTEIDWNESLAHAGIRKAKAENDDLLDFDLDDDWVERGIPRPVEERATAEPLLLQWARSLKKLIVRRNFKVTLSPSSKDDDLYLHKEIVKPISPRHTITVDLDRIFESKDWAQSFEKKMGCGSTYDAICADIELVDGPILLGSAVLNIIKQDTLIFLRRLSHYGLDQMEIGVLEETRMEDQISDWIQAISYAQREISELQASMEPFVAFCASMDSPAVASNSSESHATTEPKVLREFHQLLEMMTEMSDRLQRTSTHLTSNLGLLESRRSINEAQAVSRLTELAFVFVPLSFATSVFGMQVQPFADPVPLRSFFIVAVGVTLFAYLMRMTMRSQWLAYLKVLLRRDFQEYTERYGLPAPTRSISISYTVQWMCHGLFVGVKKVLKFVGTLCVKIWKIFGFVILFILLNGTVAGIPIAIIWTRELSPGIQCAVTIAILAIVLGTVGTFFWNYCDPEFRSALPRLIGNPFRNSDRPDLVVLSGTVPLTMVISLIVLWTRPLALDIKTGLTVGILMFVAPLITGMLCAIAANQFSYYSPSRASTSDVQEPHVDVLNLEIMPNSSRNSRRSRISIDNGLTDPAGGYSNLKKKVKRHASINYHHCLMAPLLGAIIMLSVLLAGCTSSGMSNIYLMSLRYNDYNYTVAKGPGQVDSHIAQAIQNVTQTANGTTFEVRAGYMGLCVGQSDEDKICSSSAKALANMISAERRTIQVGNESIETVPDPLNLIMIAEEFRRKIVFDGLIYVAIAMCFVTFIIISTFPGWHEETDDTGSEREVRPFPSRPLMQLSLVSSILGFAFGFISLLWQHINSSSTATMAEILTYGAVEGHIGTAAMALGWVSVFAVSMTSMGILVEILSMSLIIRKLTDDLDDE